MSLKLLEQELQQKLSLQFTLPRMSLKSVPDFPLFKHYSELTAVSMYQALRKLNLPIKNQKFFIAGYNSKKTGFNPMPPTFAGKFALIDASGVDYFKLDGITDFYTENVRMHAKKHYKELSPYDMWRAKRISLTGMSRAQIKACRDKLFQEANECTLFRVSWARTILQAISKGLRGPIRVINMSSGWGDKMIAAGSLDMEYYGFDPYLQLQVGHNEAINELGINAHIQYEPFETADLSKVGQFQIAFTSPPFFTLEEYTLDSNQSIVKYPNFDDWINLFLLKSLRKLWEVLTPGNGILALHLADFKIGLTEYNIVQPVLDNVIQFPGATWLGVLGLRGERGKVWPVWCWKKSNF